MKTTAMLLGILMILAAPLALAEEVEVDGQAQIQAQAGIGPDSALYGLENALERARLALSRNPERRAERAMDLADERIAEFEEMIAEGNFEAAERARVRYEQYLETAAESSERLDSDETVENAEEAIQRAADIRAKMQLRLDHLDEVYERILEQRADNLTDEQLDRLEDAYERASEKAQEVDLRVEQKREEAKTRLRVLADISEEEAEARADNLSQQLQDRINLRAERLVQRFENKLAALENSSDNRSEVANQRLRLAFEQKIEREEFKAEVRSEVLRARLDGATRADRAEFREEIREEADELRREFESERDGIRTEIRERIRDDGTVEYRERIREDNSGSNDLDIEAEVYENYTLVEMEIDGEDVQFELETTLREEIVEEIASRYNLTVEQVDILLEIEDGSENQLEVEVDIYSNYSIAEVEVDGQTTEYRFETTDRAELIEAIALEAGIVQADVEAVIKFEMEDEIEDDFDSDSDDDGVDDADDSDDELEDDEDDSEVEVRAEANVRV